MNGLQFTLELTGAEAADLAVVDFSLEEALSQPFTLKLRFASRDGTLSASELLDRPVTLTIWQEGEVLRRVNAIVSEFGRSDRGHRRTHYSLVARPALWRLGLRHNSRIFQHVSPLTILNTLCNECGLMDVAFAATREPETREYCVQYRESDLAFVERLAAEEGLFYIHEFFSTDEETPSPAHRLIFADAPQALAHL